MWWNQFQCMSVSSGMNTESLFVDYHFIRCLSLCGKMTPPPPPPMPSWQQSFLDIVHNLSSVDFIIIQNLFYVHPNSMTDIIIWEHRLQINHVSLLQPKQIFQMHLLTCHNFSKGWRRTDDFSDKVFKRKILCMNSSLFLLNSWPCKGSVIFSTRDVLWLEFHACHC